MPRPPDPHSLHVLRSAEVILVARFAQPAALTRRFARRAASALRAVLLPPSVAHIDRENIPAAQALALYFSGHGSPAGQTHFRLSVASRRRPPSTPHGRG